MSAISSPNCSPESTRLQMVDRSTQTSPKGSPQAAEPVILLDSNAEAMFERKIECPFVFESKDRSIQFPLKMTDFFRCLIQELEIEKIFLVGSQMADVVYGVERPHGDIDYLIVIQKPANPYAVKDAFLRALLTASKIVRMDEGEESRYYLPDGAVKRLDKSDNLFADKQLDAMGIHNNLMPFTLPVVGFKVDVSITWNSDCSCLDSSNCWQGDLFPWLQGKERLNRVSGADGYDPVEARELGGRGFFYVKEGQPSKMVNGLRGYIHTMTSLNPLGYSIEREYLKKWQEEFNTPEKRQGFLADLRKYLFKHYGHDQSPINAYLCNMRNFFNSQEYNQKEEWLERFDRAFPTQTIVIPKCFQNLADDKVGARDLQQRSGGKASHATGMADAAGCKDWDADEVTGQSLNALGYIFWNAKDLLQRRLDCQKGEFPPRFRIGRYLINAPWKETLLEMVRGNREMISRMEQWPLSQELLPKLMTLFARNRLNDFIQEFAKSMQKLQPTEIELFEKLVNKFLFGKNSMFFLQNAHKAGYTQAVKQFLLQNCPENPSKQELEFIFSVIEDIESRKQLPSSVRLFFAAGQTPTPQLAELLEGAWPPSWSQYLLLHPEVACQFPVLDLFNKAHDVFISLPPTPTSVLLLEGETPWPVSWIEALKNDSALAAEFDWDLLLKQAPEVALSLPPTPERAGKLGETPWPASWILYLEKNPAEVAKFDWQEVAKRAPNALIRHIGTLPPSMVLLDQLEGLPIELNGPPAWLEFMASNPQFFPKFAQSRTFSVDFRTRVAGRLLKDKGNFSIVWKSARENGCLPTDKNCLLAVKDNVQEAIYLVLQTNQALGAKWTRDLMKTTSIPLEKKPTDWWNILQLCARVPLTSPEDPLALLKIVLKNPEELPSIASEDSIAIAKFLHPLNFTVNVCAILQNPALIAQRQNLLKENIYKILFTLLQDAELISKREEILALFKLDFPAFRAVIDRPFGECLLPLAKDLLPSKEATRAYIDWLIPLPGSSEALSFLFETSQIDPSDALRWAKILEVPPKRLLELALPQAPEVLAPKALTFLEAQQSAKNLDLDIFEQAAMALKNWDLAVKIALEIQRLSGKNICASLHRPQKLGIEQMPLLRKIHLRGLLSLEEIWKLALPFFDKKNALFQIEVTQFCQKQAQIIDLIIKNKELPFSAVREIFNTLSTREAWQVIRLYSGKDRVKLVKPMFDKLEQGGDCIPKCIQNLVDDKVGARDLQQRSGGEASHAKGMADAAGCKDWDADEVTGQGLNVLGYRENIKLLADLCHVLAPLPKEIDVGAVFLKNVRSLKDLSPKEFWAALKPVLVKEIPDITKAHWREVYAIALTQFGKREEDLLFLPDLCANLNSSTIWSDDSFLFLTKVLNIIATPSAQSLSTWGKLVDIFHFITSEPLVKREAAAELCKHYELCVAIGTHFSAESVEAYRATQIPILTAEEWILELQALVENPDAEEFSSKWMEKWEQLPNIQWKLENFIPLLELFDTVSKSLPPHSTLGTHYMLQFQLLSHLHNCNSVNPSLELQTIQRFHDSFLKLYAQYGAFLATIIADQQQPPMILVGFKHIKQFAIIAMKTVRHPLLTIDLNAFLNIQEKGLPLSYLISKNYALHASLLGLGHTRSQAKVKDQPSAYPPLSRQLFETLKRSKLFQDLYQSSIGTLYRELFSTFVESKEDWFYLPNEIVLLVKNKTSSSEEKQLLFSGVLREMTTQTGLSVTPTHSLVAFEFLEQLIRNPECQMNLGIVVVQATFLMIFRDLSRAGNLDKNPFTVRRALDCVDRFMPLLRFFYPLLVVHKDIETEKSFSIYEKRAYKIMALVWTDKSLITIANCAASQPSLAARGKQLHAELRALHKKFVEPRIEFVREAFGASKKGT